MAINGFFLLLVKILKLAKGSFEGVTNERFDGGVMRPLVRRATIRVVMDLFYRDTSAVDAGVELL